MKKEFNIDYVDKLEKEEINFQLATEIAYMLGKDNLDDNFIEFINEKTFCEGIYAFSVFVRFLYKEFNKNNGWDVYEFIEQEYDNCFEKFKRECFR